MDDTRLHDIVSQTVLASLPGTVIDAIDVVPDVDHDGDRVIRIAIVFNGNVKSLDGDKMVGLARHLKRRLEEQGYFEFPLVKFISSHDARKLHIAAA